MRNYEEIIENQIGDNPENWLEEDVVNSDDLYPYTMPELEDLAKSNIQSYYYGYYIKWNVSENFRYVSSKINFKTAARGRTYGTYTNFDSLDDYMDDMYYYMNYIKFGYGRCIRDLSRHIQKGEISRKEALAIARKYDGEFPEDSIKHILNYLEISKESLLEIIDSHRTPKVWEKNGKKWINKLEKHLE